MIFQIHSCEYPYTVQFTDNSTDIDGWIEEWYWNFGDERTNSTEQNPSHQYTALGTYTVTLNVTDNDGAAGNVSKNINVGPLFASFTCSPSLPTTAHVITFNASTSHGGGNGTIISYEWDWTSDGTIDDTGITASHQYGTEGTHTVTLTVTNNHGAADNASHNITVTIPLGEAVDNTDLSWSTDSDSEYGNWFGQSTTYYYDGDAAQSGRIGNGNNQASWIQTNVTGPGSITFYWNVSSEAGYDFLRFFIDGIEQASISGEEDWHQMSFDISDGSHTLKWAYTKDEYVKAGSDCGWLDKVVYAQIFILHTCEDLQNMKNNLSASYYLANDIDCSDTVNWNSGAGFEPVGTFTGTFDGQGHKITDLYINRPSTDYAGLFGCTSSGSEIRNIGLENVVVTGNEYVGGLAGQNRGTITNSSSTGSVTGNEARVGGLAGRNYGGTIENCYSTAGVNGWQIVGGLVGSNRMPYGGTMARILNSYSTGSITGTWRVGGLAGQNYWDGEIINSYSHSSVSGDSDIGGLVGLVYGVTEAVPQINLIILLYIKTHDAKSKLIVSS